MMKHVLNREYIGVDSLSMHSFQMKEHICSCLQTKICISNYKIDHYEPANPKKDVSFQKMSYKKSMQGFRQVLQGLDRKV